MIVGDQEYLDFNNVPQSRGIGRPALIIGLIGILGIFIVGGMSIGFASWGHMWPSEHSMRMDLGKMNQ